MGERVNTEDLGFGHGTVMWLHCQYTVLVPNETCILKVSELLLIKMHAFNRGPQQRPQDPVVLVVIKYFCESEKVVR